MSYEDTLRQYLEAAIPSRSVSPIPLERDQEIPPYEGTDETQQTLARLLGPLPNSPQLQEPPSLPPPFDRLPDTSAWVASRTDQQPPLTASSRFLANAPRSLSDAEQFADMSPAEIDLRPASLDEIEVSTPGVLGNDDLTGLKASRFADFGEFLNLSGVKTFTDHRIGQKVSHFVHGYSPLTLSLSNPSPLQSIISHAYLIPNS